MTDQYQAQTGFATADVHYDYDINFSLLQPAEG